MNKNLNKVTPFKACPSGCKKGEPIELSDARFLQANHCSNGNTCVIVGDKPRPIDQLASTSNDEISYSGIYTKEELSILGEGSVDIGRISVLTTIVKQPDKFLAGEPKPLSQPDGYYDGYVGHTLN
jgi:hypothetical protein